MEALKTFNIKYDIVFEGGITEPDKDTKVKNCISDMHAKVKLHTWVETREKKKGSQFKTIVIKSCNEDYGLGEFGDMPADAGLGDAFLSLFGGMMK
jgi:hypothetical protein